MSQLKNIPAISAIDTCPDSIWTIQNAPINILCSTSFKDDFSLDLIEDVATIHNSGLTLCINQYSTLTVKELRVSLYRMIDCLLHKFVSNFDLQKTVTLTLKEYMQLCNLSDTKTARKQLKDDLQIWYNCSMSYTLDTSSQDKSYPQMRLCQDHNDIKNSILSFTLGDKFFDMLKSRSMHRMLLPVIVLQSNPMKNPNSYFLGKKIFIYYRSNFNKNRKTIISVKNLLKNCPNLKNWKTVKNKSQLIQSPFERDMDFLSPQIKWYYCKSGGVKYTEEELTTFSFKEFTNAYIEFETQKEYIDLMHSKIKPNTSTKKKSQNRKQTKK
jgi:hypothetical protein